MPAAPLAPARRPVLALLEILAMWSLLLSYIWGWQGSFPGDFWLCLALYFALGLLTHAHRGETPAELGIRLDNLGPAAGQTLRFLFPIHLLLLAAGALMGSFHFPPFPEALAKILPGILWGTAQQYGLLCFFLRRLGDLLPGEGARIAAASLLFSLLHLPNPFLVPVTFAAGALSCVLYRRVPNLPILGIAHGATGFLLAHALPSSLNWGMRVGPGLLERLR